MSEIKDGGLAFPGTRTEKVGTVSDYGFIDDDSPTYADVTHPGMTLRDWFAGQAIRARWVSGDPMTAYEAASFAYQLADAMLAAREVAK